MKSKSNFSFSLNDGLSYPVFSISVDPVFPSFPIIVFLEPILSLPQRAVAQVSLL